MTYTCDHGYELNAHPVMFCESNGNFNDSKPECIPKGKVSSVHISFTKLECMVALCCASLHPQLGIEQ